MIIDKDVTREFALCSEFNIDRREVTERRQNTGAAYGLSALGKVADEILRTDGVACSKELQQELMDSNSSSSLQILIPHLVDEVMAGLMLREA